MHSYRVHREKRVGNFAWPCEPLVEARPLGLGRVGVWQPLEKFVARDNAHARQPVLDLDDAVVRDAVVGVVGAHAKVKRVALLRIRAKWQRCSIFSARVVEPRAKLSCHLRA